MTDDQAPQDTSAETATESVSPGRMLREGRERLNLSLEQVAERLRLRQQIIDDLEQDQFDKYVAGTFTRGYLRAYARLVNVDEAAVLAAYESLGVKDTPQDMQSFSRRTSQQSQDNRLMLVTYIIGAIIIGSAIIFWLQNNSQTQTDENIDPQGQQQGVAERMVAEQETQVDIEPAENSATSAATREPIFIDTSLLGADQREPVESQQQGSSPEQEPAESTDQPTTEEAPQDVADTALAEQAQVAEQQTAEQESTGPAVVNDQDTSTMGSDIPEADLVLLFANDTWIRIEDATGEAIAFGVKSEGHISALDGQPPYDITLGAPENVTLYFQGSPIDLSSYRAGRVARLSVPVTE